MNHINCEYVGWMCAYYRRHILRIPQSRVALETGYSRSNISAFENGRTDNTTIFMWYIKNGIFEWIPPKKWNNKNIKSMIGGYNE